MVAPFVEIRPSGPMPRPIDKDRPMFAVGSGTGRPPAGRGLAYKSYSAIPDQHTQGRRSMGLLPLAQSPGTFKVGTAWRTKQSGPGRSIRSRGPSKPVPIEP